MNILDEWKTIISPQAMELIQCVYDEFDASGRWPNALRTYMKFRKKFNLLEINTEIGWPIVSIQDPRDKRSLVKLSIYGIALADGSEKYVDLFFNALHLAVTHFIKDPHDDNLTHQKLIDDLSLSKNDAWKLYELFSSTVNIFHGSGANPDQLEFHLRMEIDILDYENINSLDELYVKQRRHFPPKFGGPVKDIQQKPQFIPYSLGYEQSIQNGFKCFKIGSPSCPKTPEIKNTQVFIGMPFKEEFEDIYSNGIVPALKHVGLMPYRADKDIKNIDIMCKICEAIQSSRYGIINITNWNPNVLFELGLLYGLGKNVLLIKDKDSDVPVDLKGIEYIDYSEPKEVIDKIIQFISQG